MTNVISLARVRVVKTVQTPARSNPLICSDAIQRQALIENALSMALHHVRGDACGNLQAATAKANRALSLLKQACAAKLLTVREG